MEHQVTIIPDSQMLAGPGWNLEAERIEVLNDLDGGTWSAVIDIRQGLKLLIMPQDSAELLWIEAWSGEPGRSEGVAVVKIGRKLGLALVPQCGCGDLGCGNTGVQLNKAVLARNLPELLRILGELPWSETSATVENVLRGESIAALNSPKEISSHEKLTYHGNRWSGGTPVERIEVDLRNNPDTEA